MGCEHDIAQLRVGLGAVHCLGCKRKWRCDYSIGAMRVLLLAMQRQRREIEALRALVASENVEEEGDAV